MITVRYQQRTIYEPLAVNCMADYQELLWEGWLVKVDKFLEDEDLVKIVREALEKRHPHSRTRGRLGTPAEVVLRLMALKHLRNWSYQELERECGPMSCIGSLPGLAARRCLIPRRWCVGGKL